MLRCSISLRYLEPASNLYNAETDMNNSFHELAVPTDFSVVAVWEARRVFMELIGETPNAIFVSDTPAHREHAYYVIKHLWEGQFFPSLEFVASEAMNGWWVTRIGQPVKVLVGSRGA